MAGKSLQSDRISISLSSSASAIRRLLRSEMAREIVALAMLLAVAFFVLSIVSFKATDVAGASYPIEAAPANLGGRIGAGLVGWSYLYFGAATYLIVALLAMWAGLIFFRRRIDGWPLKLFGACLAATAFAAFFGGSLSGSAIMPTGGGVVGTVIYDVLTANCGLSGTYLILSFVLALSFLLATEVLFYPLLRDFFFPDAGDRQMDEDLEISFDKTDSTVSFVAATALASHGKFSFKTLTGGLLAILGIARKDEAEESAAYSTSIEAPESAVGTLEVGEEEYQCEEDGDEEPEEEDEDEDDSGVHDVQIEIPAPLPKKKKRVMTERQKKKLREKMRKRRLLEVENYRPPSPEILERGRKANSSTVRRDMNNKAQQIVKTLAHFKIDVEIIDVRRGPTISMFELKTPSGLPLKRIAVRDKELEMMLETPHIRILTPIPGRNTVGIEVPNSVRDMVSLREIVTSEEFIAASKTMELPLALGLDAEGRPLIRDLAKAPHLLIAGTTGSGKSVEQNIILLSLLFTRHFRDVRLLLADPKSVELTPYQELPFLTTPVITDMTKAVAAFEWLVEEMESRYEFLANTRTKKISEYNALPVEERRARFKQRGGDPDRITERMPYIVCMVDELADMMMVNAETRIDELICRVAQKARAVGIHLILATQRPSTDIVTGLIKANVPARIGFKLPNSIDSRTIINSVGAEKLLGQGDMLLDWADGRGVMRGQSAFSDTPEIERVCQAVRDQAEPRYLIKPKALHVADPNEDMIGGQPKHEKFDEAVITVLNGGRASAQFLRSALRIGYNAATTIIMQMEMAGVIGPARGSKEREVVMTLEQWESLNENLDDEEDIYDVDI